MKLVWNWAIRAPLAGLAIAASAAGAASIIEWGLALSVTAIAAIGADVAHRLGRRAQQRAMQRTSSSHTLDEVRSIRAKRASGRKAA